MHSIHSGIRDWGTLTDLRTGHSWTPELIERLVAARVARFTAAGLEPGGCAFILHDNRAHFLADLLAIWAIRGWAACIDPRRPRDEVLALAEKLRPKLWLDAGSDAADFPNIVRIPTPTILAVETGAAPAPRLTAADDCGVILLSSGTTGTPKVIHLSFRAITTRVALNRKYMQRSPERTLCLLPMHFGHGLIGNCLTPWSAGSDLVLADGGDLSTLASLGPLIDDHLIDFMSSVPTIWRIVLELSRRPELNTLSRVHIGSAPLTESLWRDVIEWTGTQDVANTYGLTETANWVAGASAAEFEPRDGLVGRPWGGRAAIRGWDGAISSCGRGEIVLCVPSVMILPPAGGPVENGWFRTGDTGEIDGQGVIRILGRIDHLINRGGINIQPEEIEWQAERHPAVAEVCAFAVPHSQAGQTVGLAVRTRSGEPFSENAFRAWCKERMRPEAVPEHIFFVAGMPVNERGKVNTRVLIRHCLKTMQAQPGGREGV